MDLKKIVEYSPLIVSFLIFNGFLKLYVFYDHWGIPIIHYLDFSEIILSFLNDLNILMLFGLLFISQQVLGYRFFESTDRLFRNKMPRPGFLHNQTNPSVNSVNTGDENFEKPITEMVDYFFTRRSLLLLLFHLGLAILCVYWFYRYSNELCLYLSVVFSFRFFEYTINYLVSIEENLSLLISSILSVLTFTLCIATYDICNVSVDAKHKVYTIRIEGEEIITSDSYYYLGKTQNYLYLFNSQTSTTQIFPSESIKSIKIQVMQQS